MIGERGGLVRFDVNALHRRERGERRGRPRRKPGERPRRTDGPDVPLIPPFSAFSAISVVKEVGSRKTTTCSVWQSRRNYEFRFEIF